MLFYYLFAYAEAAEYLVYDIVADGFAGELAQGFPGGAQVDGEEVQAQAAVYGGEGFGEVALGFFEDFGFFFVPQEGGLGVGSVLEDEVVDGFGEGFEQDTGYSTWLNRRRNYKLKRVGTRRMTAGRTVTIDTWRSESYNSVNVIDTGVLTLEETNKKVSVGGFGLMYLVKRKLWIADDGSEWIFLWDQWCEVTPDAGDPFRYWSEWDYRVGEQI